MHSGLILGGIFLQAPGLETYFKKTPILSDLKSHDSRTGALGKTLNLV